MAGNKAKYYKKEKGLKQLKCVWGLGERMDWFCGFKGKIRSNHNISPS